jgi:hypothetical protein
MQQVISSKKSMQQLRDNEMMEAARSNILGLVSKLG